MPPAVTLIREVREDLLVSHPIRLPNGMCRAIRYFCRGQIVTILRLVRVASVAGIYLAKSHGLERKIRALMAQTRPVRHALHGAFC